MSSRTFEIFPAFRRKSNNPISNYNEIIKYQGSTDVRTYNAMRVFVRFADNHKPREHN